MVLFYDLAEQIIGVGAFGIRLSRIFALNVNERDYTKKSKAGNKSPSLNLCGFKKWTMKS